MIGQGSVGQEDPTKQGLWHRDLSRSHISVVSPYLFFIVSDSQRYSAFMPPKTPLIHKANY